MPPAAPVSIPGPSAMNLVVGLFIAGTLLVGIVGPFSPMPGIIGTGHDLAQDCNADENGTCAPVQLVNVCHAALPDYKVYLYFQVAHGSEEYLEHASHEHDVVNVTSPADCPEDPIIVPSPTPSQSVPPPTSWFPPPQPPPPPPPPAPPPPPSSSPAPSPTPSPSPSPGPSNSTTPTPSPSPSPTPSNSSSPTPSPSPTPTPSPAPAPAVTLSQSGSPMAESGGTSTVTATLDGPSSQVVVANLTFSGNATRTSDYVPSGDNITIPAGSTTGTVTFTAAQDTVDEADELVSIEIASVTNGVESGEQTVSLLIVDDNPPPTVTVALSGSPMAEDGGVATITATLSSVSSRDVSIDLAFSGNASATSDYTSTGTSILIAAGQTSGSLTLTAVQDTLVEGNETLLIDTSSVTNAVESGTQQETATITDDDVSPPPSSSEPPP